MKSIKTNHTNTMHIKIHTQNCEVLRIRTTIHSVKTKNSRQVERHVYRTWVTKMFLEVITLQCTFGWWRFEFLGNGHWDFFFRDWFLQHFKISTLTDLKTWTRFLKRSKNKKLRKTMYNTTPPNNTQFVCCHFNMLVYSTTGMQVTRVSQNW